MTKVIFWCQNFYFYNQFCKQCMYVLLLCFSFSLSQLLNPASFIHFYTHTGEMMIIRNTLLRQKFLGIFRAYKVLLSLAFLLLCGIITVPVTYSTFYSTSSAEYYVIDTIQDWKIRSGVQFKVQGVPHLHGFHYRGSSLRFSAL